MTANADVDRRVYELELSLWLPPKIIDCHTHVALQEHCGPISPDRFNLIWAMEVGAEQSWDQLRANYRTLFPEREVRALAFGNVYREVDIGSSNDYILAGLADPRNRAHGLFVVKPEWNPDAIADAMSKGFLGIKPYYDLAPQGVEDVSIYDFVTKPQLAVLNELGGIMMLHVPRKGRLADPDNIREVLEINDTFPGIRMILAHIGRSYCFPTAERGLPHFADRTDIFFDTSANLNPDVFRYALETIGPDRLLFGTDLPVTLMRGVREYVGERYINYTDGPYSWNTNRKSREEEARYTYYLYEELRAMIEAVKQVGLGKDAMEKMMYSNAAGLLNWKSSK